MNYNDIYNAASKRGNEFAEWIKRQCYSGRFIPEIIRQKDFKQNHLHHPEGNVFEHTMAALKDYKGSNPIINLSILFHDVGKPDSAIIAEDGNYYKFYNHDKIGVDVFNNISRRMKFPKDVSEIISFVIENHMRFHKIYEMKTKKIKSLINSPYWNILSKVAYHDDHCRGKNKFSFEEYKQNYMKAKKYKERK